SVVLNRAGRRERHRQHAQEVAGRLDQRELNGGRVRRGYAGDGVGVLERGDVRRGRRVDLRVREVGLLGVAVVVQAGDRAEVVTGVAHEATGSGVAERLELAEEVLRGDRADRGRVPVDAWLDVEGVRLPVSGDSAVCLRGHLG